MKRILVAAVCILLYVAPAALADVPEIPENIKQVLKTAPTRTLFAVSDRVVVSDPVIKADEISFSSSASLVLSEQAVRQPYIIIAARRWKFADPSRPIRIGILPGIQGRNGVPGPDGKPGSNAGQAPSGHGGYDGAAGTPGLQGGAGETLNLPPIYIVVGSLESQRGHIDTISLRWMFQGLDGGPGGSGGIGGSGGGGGRGGDDVGGRLGDCAQGPGGGGNGGGAGVGGQGGVGGNGGNGADVSFIGPKAILESLSFTPVYNDSGAPGLGGPAGAPGSPGLGGPAGDHRHCEPREAGRTGASTPKNDSERGPEGKPGHKGTVKLVNMESVDSLF